jgi:hypothetical protein
MRTKQVIFYLLLVVVSLMFFPSSHAQMALLSDVELDSLYATGFSNFSITNGIARMEFNINFSTYTEIDSLKLCYHDYACKAKGASGNWHPGVFGWDEDWENVALGSSDEPLIGEGLILEAKFSNISNPALRSLESLRIGTNLQGSISADFNSFTGRINYDPADDASGEFYSREDMGTNTLTSKDLSEFYIELSNVDQVITDTHGQDYLHRGICIGWEEATFQ